MAVDSADNVYLSVHTFSFDMVLVKYDSSGVQQWNVTWGGTDYDGGWKVAVDSADNVYLVGETTSFGAGAEDMVLVKYGLEKNSEEEPTIFGYDLLLFINVIGVVATATVILISFRRRRKLS